MMACQKCKGPILHRAYKVNGQSWCGYCYHTLERPGETEAEADARFRQLAEEDVALVMWPYRIFTQPEDQGE